MISDILRAYHVPSAITTTSFTRFDGTCQFLASTRLHKNELPTLIEDPFYVGWNIHDLTRRDYLVITMDIAIIELLIPKAILSPLIFLHILHFRLMSDLT
jgi:hypothetical protein